MKDITIDQLADKVRDELKLNISRRASRKLVRHLLAYTFKVMRTNKDVLSMRESDVLQVYKDYDVEGICRDLAEGKPDVITVNEFQDNNKLAKVHKKFLKRPCNHLINDLLNPKRKPEINEKQVARTPVWGDV